MTEDGRKVALLAGINEYPHDPLRFAVHDVEEMAALLTQQEYAYQTIVLTDAQATRTAILEVFDSFHLDPPSSVIFFFSGHGYTTTWGRAFLGTFGASRPDEGLDVTQLVQMLDTMPSPNASALAFLDCCHSGMLSSWKSASPLTPSSIEAAVRGYSEQRALFAACRPDENAYSAVESLHGAFTHHLIEAIAGGAADHNGEITVEDVVSYVRRHFVSSEQTTVYRGDSAGRVVLGRGFKPSSNRPLTRNEAAKYVTEGNRLLQGYESHLRNSLEDWSARGYAEAIGAFRPVVDWFERTQKKHPEVLNDDGFRKLKSRLTSKQSHLQNLEVGQVVDGLRVAERIGSGGFGTVWRLEAAADGASSMALKLFNPNQLDDSNMRRMFERGYRAMERLDHGRVVRVRGRCIGALRLLHGLHTREKHPDNAAFVG